ncbi:MAG: hypothetical protein NT116_02550 [Candidatus Parcubacteria bacterium]|nr:hypothetical protein [Candidatus Parcubacteria bacterium]
MSKEEKKTESLLKLDIKNKEAILKGEEYFNNHLNQITKRPKVTASNMALKNCEDRALEGELTKEESQYCKCGTEKGFYGEPFNPNNNYECLKAGEGK